MVALLFLLVSSVAATSVLAITKGSPDDASTPLIEPEPEPALASPVPANCQIKGSVAVNGQKIYQRPGDEFYHQATVDSVRGERMFCSDAEAQAAGWQHGSLPPAPADGCDRFKTREDAAAGGKRCNTLPSKTDVGEIGQPSLE